MKAVRIHEFGGPEVLKIEDIPAVEVKKNQVLVKLDSTGVNFADVLRRQGKYPGPDLPCTLGLEGSGTIIELGEGVSGLTIGQKAMVLGPQCHAEMVSVNKHFVFPFDDSKLSTEISGGMPLTFLTAYHLLNSRGRLEKDHTVLIHSGASGVGTIAIQMAKNIGATVISTASTKEKMDLCESLGADTVINYSTDDFQENINELTDGTGVDLVLDAVGGPNLEKSLNCVKPYGTLISYGNASGTMANIPSSDSTSLNRTIIGFSMGRSPIGTLDHQTAMAEILTEVYSGKLKLIVDQTLPLSQVGTAHDHLFGRQSKGKVILIP